TAPPQIDRAAVEAQLVAILRQLLNELGSEQASSQLTPRAHLERDLALGSLERVELLLRLGKEFKIHLPDKVVAEADTLEDLLVPVEKALARSATATPPDVLSAPLAHVRRHEERVHVPKRQDDTRLAEHAETLNEVLELRARTHPDRPQI